MLISCKFYLIYLEGAGGAHGIPQRTGWEPVLYRIKYASLMEISISDDLQEEAKDFCKRFISKTEMKRKNFVISAKKG